MTGIGNSAVQSWVLNSTQHYRVMSIILACPTLHRFMPLCNHGRVYKYYVGLNLKLVSSARQFI